MFCTHFPWWIELFFFCLLLIYTLISALLVLDHFTPMMRFELRRDEFANSDSDQSSSTVCFDIQLAIGVSQEISQFVRAHVTIKSSENIHKKGFSFHSHDASSFSPILAIQWTWPYFINFCNAQSQSCNVYITVLSERERAKRVKKAAKQKWAPQFTSSRCSHCAFVHTVEIERMYMCNEKRGIDKCMQWGLPYGSTYHHHEWCCCCCCCFFNDRAQCSAERRKKHNSSTRVQWQ